MGLLILSKETTNPNKTLSSITVAAIEANLSLFISENAKSTSGRIELELKKVYGEEEEYLSVDIIPINEQIELSKPHLMGIKYLNYFMIAGTSDAYYGHLIYDFSLSYLRLNSDKIISIYDEIFITLEGINKIEALSGFYSGWMKEFKKEF